MSDNAQPPITFIEFGALETQAPNANPTLKLAAMAAAQSGDLKREHMGSFVNAVQSGYKHTDEAGAANFVREQLDRPEYSGFRTRPKGPNLDFSGPNGDLLAAIANMNGLLP